MSLTAYVFQSFNCSNPRPKDKETNQNKQKQKQTNKQKQKKKKKKKTSPEMYKNEIKVLANPGLA